MTSFPQQVRTEELGQTLQDFYDSKNQEIKGKLKEYPNEKKDEAH